MNVRFLLSNCQSYWRLCWSIGQMRWFKTFCPSSLCINTVWLWEHLLPLFSNIDRWCDHCVSVSYKNWSLRTKSTPKVTNRRCCRWTITWNGVEIPGYLVILITAANFLVSWWNKKIFLLKETHIHAAFTGLIRMQKKRCDKECFLSVKIFSQVSVNRKTVLNKTRNSLIVSRWI